MTRGWRRLQEGSSDLYCPADIVTKGYICGSACSTQGRFGWGTCRRENSSKMEASMGGSGS